MVFIFVVGGSTREQTGDGTADGAEAAGGAGPGDDKADSAGSKGRGVRDKLTVVIYISRGRIFGFDFYFDVDVDFDVGVDGDVDFDFDFCLNE